METTFSYRLKQSYYHFKFGYPKIAPDFDDPSSPPEKNSKVLNRDTRAIFYLQWQCSFNKLLHCRRMRKFLCVECLALAMQHLLKSCRNIENSYNNIGNLSVSTFCRRTVYWCSHVANFPRDGNAMISENYTAISGEKVLLWS